jgi:hypothetical protein
MDWSHQRALVPHYAAVVLLIGVYVIAVRVAFGDVVPLVDIVGVLIVVLSYPTIVRSLGVAPNDWE